MTAAQFPEAHWGPAVAMTNGQRNKRRRSPEIRLDVSREPGAMSSGAAPNADDEVEQQRLEDEREAELALERRSMRRALAAKLADECDAKPPIQSNPRDRL